MSTQFTVWVVIGFTVLYARRWLAIKVRNVNIWIITSGANDGDFWIFCKEHYKVFPDLTDREAEYLHDNTGRMFNLDPPFDGKKCPVYNCSYWVDMNQVLNEVRTQPDKDIIELERVGYHPFGEGAHPRWILPGQEKYIEMQRAMTERMKKHQQLG